MPDYDCLACGACCTHAGEVVVEASEDVPKHLTRSVRGRVGFASWEAEEGTRIMARRCGGSCSALSPKAGQQVCRIYERRPAVCRAFTAGSPQCLAARATAGLPDQKSVTPAAD